MSIVFHFSDHVIEEIQLENVIYVADKATDTSDLESDELKNRESVEEHKQFITSMKQKYPILSNQQEIINTYNRNPEYARC
jgi:hypothetical protein